jgi:hypothetical protein
VLLQCRVEFVGFGSALIEYAVEIVEPAIVVGERQPRPQPTAFPGRQAQLIMRRNFGAPTVRPHGLGVAVHDIIVDAVLEVVAGCLDPAEPPDIGLALTEQKFRAAVAVKPQLGQLRMIDRYRMILAVNQQRPHRIGLPRPDVARPELRQHMQ